MRERVCSISELTSDRFRGNKIKTSPLPSPPHPCKKGPDQRENMALKGGALDERPGKNMFTESGNILHTADVLLA